MGEKGRIVDLPLEGALKGGKGRIVSRSWDSLDEGLDIITHDFTSVCFNLPPTSKDCLVIGFSCGGDATTKIGLLRRGQRIWDTYEYDNASFRPGSPSPVLFNGMYYVLGIRGNIGVFDLKNQSWEIFVERFEPEFVDSLCQSYLLELDGELVAVFFSIHNQVYFYSLDLTKMVWHSRTSTGDKLLYVSYTSAFSRRATVKGMSNKIYFPIFSGKNSVFYSLRTKRFHSFDADHPNKMRELRLSTWIEPSFERHGQLIW
ncbi:hypothetical protein CDL12_29613 [Handroanthus impetiginosus]|uniref:KIB1-4 beta-propeller domain-containing protein n=1 Tax=Handroanthus impetiginosus TaxID=429701 RepID=A0A2G9FXX2_9LAMI|nr:hypothetical protein CDL12_29613 [Handroanthus impetiginosus]